MKWERCPIDRYYKVYFVNMIHKESDIISLYVSYSRKGRHLVFFLKLYVPDLIEMSTEKNTEKDRGTKSHIESERDHKMKEEQNRW